MKRKLFYIFFVLLFIFCLASCDNKQNDNDNNQNNNQNNNNENGNNNENNNGKKEEAPKLADDYYTNLVDTSSAYKFSINKLYFPTSFTDSVLVSDSYVEFNLTDDTDFEVYGDINYKVYKSFVVSQNMHAKFYLLNTDAYYELTDVTTSTKKYAHLDILEIEDVAPFITTLNEELTKYFNLNISTLLTTKELKQNIVSTIEQSLTSVLKTILTYKIEENVTLSLNYDGLNDLNNKLATESAATSIDSIFGPFTFLNIKNLLCGTVSKSIFDYKMSDVLVGEQYSNLSIDNIEADINKYLPKINSLLGKYKLPFNSVKELMELIASKFEIEIPEDIKLKDFLQIEELTNLTINDIYDKFNGSHVDLKKLSKEICDLCYKYSFYQFINALSSTTSIDQLPETIKDAKDVGFKATVDSVIDLISKIELKVITDKEGNLTKATLNFVPDDSIIDFDLELIKITFESKDSFKALVLANI